LIGYPPIFISFAIRVFGKNDGKDFIATGITSGLHDRMMGIVTYKMGSRKKRMRTTHSGFQSSQNINPPIIVEYDSDYLRTIEK
jgi:hypothetical protein